MTPPDLFNLPGIQSIRHLLVDPTITEIMINRLNQVYIERNGRKEKLNFQFENDQQVGFLVETLMRGTGRSVDASNPCVDFRLPDGSRVSVVLPPAALDGVIITIRKFTRSLESVNDLIKAGTLNKRMAQFLTAAVQAKLNVMFSGATGAGKTTTLNILSAWIPKSERIVTIEDTAELSLQQDHVVRLESRGANVEGDGAISIADLLHTSLRMRPSRIIVGEVRGGEIIDLLQAITSGHEGCLSVLHASSPYDAVQRMEVMAMLRGLDLPLWAIHRLIASAIDIIVQHELLPDGIRRITRITEVGDAVDNQIELRDLFEYQHHGPNAEGIFEGSYLATGTEPTFMSRFEQMGVEIPADLFSKD